MPNTYELDEAKNMIVAENGVSEEQLNNSLTPYYDETKLKAYLDSYMPTYLNTWKTSNFGTGAYSNTGNINLTSDTSILTFSSNTVNINTNFGLSFAVIDNRKRLVINNNTSNAVYVYILFRNYSSTNAYISRHSISTGNSTTIEIGNTGNLPCIVYWNNVAPRDGSGDADGN